MKRIFTFIMLSVLIGLSAIAQETTPVVGTLIDNDGHTYNYRKIGTQVWMTENLRTSKYRNGERISNLTLAADWSAATLGAWCYYNNVSMPNPPYFI
jgi:hypothetical protein